MKRTCNKDAGITLIALIITIIILLILAGITILTISGKNGLFIKTKQAKEKTENAKEQEDMILEEYWNAINNHIDNKEADALTAEMFSFTPNDKEWNVKDVKQALDYLYND